MGSFLEIFTNPKKYFIEKFLIQGSDWLLSKLPANNKKTIITSVIFGILFLLEQTGADGLVRTGAEILLQELADGAGIENVDAAWETLKTATAYGIGVGLYHKLIKFAKDRMKIDEKEEEKSE